VIGVSAGTAGGLAAVTASGKLLWRTATSSPMTAAPGEWRSASWVRSLGLLGVQKSGGTLMFLSSKGALATVDDGGLRKAGPVSAVSVSRDGARVAALAGPPGAQRVYLGRLSYAPPFSADTAPGQRPAVVAAGGWTPVTPAGEDVRAVDWTASLELAGIAADGAGSGTIIFRIPLDGPAVAGTLSTRGLLGPAEAIAAAPGEPLLVASGGRIWRYDDSGTGRWLPIGAGSLPAYPS
jgi:hypothetical protein